MSKTCTTPNCIREQRARQLCNACYRRKIRDSSLSPAPTVETYGIPLPKHDGQAVVNREWFTELGREVE